MATTARASRPTPAAVAPTMPEPHPVELLVCQAAVLVGGLLMLRTTREAFNLGRATVLALLGVGLAVLLVDALRRTPRQRPSAVVVAVAVFAAAVVVTWVITPSLSNGFFGPYSRQTGAATYLTGILLFVAMARHRGELAVRALLGAVAVASAIAIAYGVLQGLGGDPFSWGDSTLGTVFSTFGQVNFAAAYVGIVTPVLAYFALRSDLADVWRGLSALACAGALYVAVETHSFQGLVALAAGLLPLAAFLLAPTVGRLPVRRRALLLGAVVLVVAVLVAGTAGYLDQQLSSGFHERLLFWRAGLSMIGHHPVLGQGFGAFADHFFRFRPAQHALEYGLQGADAPHSVPLDMFINGGLVLGLAYLAFVVLIGRELVRLIRVRRDLLVATVAGMWLAYQVQSLVSFDMPSLLTLHFLLAGCIVALGRTAPTSPPRRPARAPSVDWAPVVAAGAAVLLLLWPLTAPLRADMLARRAETRPQGEAPFVVADLRKAWQTHHTGAYAAEEATLLFALGNVGQAGIAGERAVASAPGSVQYAVTLGKLQLRLGQQAAAKRTFAKAIADNPRDPWMVADIGEAYVQAGDAELGLPYFRRSLRIHRAPSVLDMLSRAYANLNRPEDVAKVNDAAAALRAEGHSD